VQGSVLDLQWGCLLTNEGVIGLKDNKMILEAKIQLVVSMKIENILCFVDKENVINLIRVRSSGGFE
jgi:hypothetical protein